MSFYENDVLRDRAGQFDTKPLSSAEEGVLRAPVNTSIFQNLPESRLRPAHMLHTETRHDYPDPLDGSPTGGIDLFVDTIANGHLSRGTPGKAGVDAARAWRIWGVTTASATGDPRFSDFADGVGAAAVCLMASKLGLDERMVGSLATGNSVAGEGLVREAETLLQTKRAQQADRDTWIKFLKLTVNEENWRGQWVSGAALSQIDSWWGFREDPERAALG